jgi:hypothetical protein
MHRAEQRDPRKAWHEPSITVLTRAAEAALLFRNGHDGFHQQGKHGGGGS